MWPSDGLFDKTVRLPICSLSSHKIVCVKEEKGRNKEREMECFYASRRQTDASCPLVRDDELKAGGEGGSV